MSERANARLRFLDRYVGIPAVWALSCLRRRRARPENVRAIGLLKTAAIGDTVILSAVVPDLRRRFPGAQLVLFAGSSNVDVGRMITGLDEVVHLPVRKVGKSVRRIRSMPVDVLFDFGSWPRFDAMLARLSDARYTVGFRTAGQFRHYGYDEAVEHAGNVHELENCRRLVGTFGVEAAGQPKIFVPAGVVVPAKLPAEYVVFHAWSGGYKKHLKEWPDANWVELTKRAVAAGLNVVFTGGQSDRERTTQLIKPVSADAGRLMNVAGELTLAETVEVLRRSRAVVSVCTGIMHLAAAVGARVVSLHGPTSSKRWGAVGPAVLPVDAPGSGCGFLNLGFEDEGQRADCMASISVDAVWTALRKQIGA